MARAMSEAAQTLVARCYANVDALSLQRQLVDQLGRILPVDAVFCASVDPPTLLMTGAVVHEIPPELSPLFLANEFLEDDVIKFRTLANRRVPVDWLDRATGNERGRSARYRNLMAPIGLGDELRAAFRSGGECWGFLCIHRADAHAGFTEREARLVARLSSHVGEALRRALLVGEADTTADAPGPGPVNGPGVLVIGERQSLVAATAAGDYWLWELSRPDPVPRLPLAVESVLTSLEAVRVGRLDGVPRIRVRTRSGRWAVLHAADMAGLGEGRHVVVVVEAAEPAAIAPLLLQAYGLTPREGQVAQAALQGQSNKATARALRISEHTVEDHLKSIYNKVGVASRGELSARIFADQYTHPSH